ncbi:MAG TPA: kinase [Deltaproteobacteria bacterium]|nr:MAG: kinase [Deltaproteobacteria bacterium GWA2_55_82]OGQ63143.1 MAG: kinase [Deltaproteobacteria bacterium RIFCSPLOWO2_02_FULL_55_12]OIJ73608.1 MAG: kinase [Deltaproteobacteria bacterium GWC2_55_46]HBG47745.1 kinase [Deltaproteobacteria bacterium]HCY12033.1 kinase [Deltaproteobacteria bacterium]
MIITRTPHRISFFGGGTDYPSWYMENGGKVLGTAIDKYCYITCRELPPFFKHRHRIAYSKVETVTDMNEIQHPSVKETLKYLNIGYGVEIHHDGDIPARSGMGSSSAFTVGLLNALYAIEGKRITKEDLYREAIHIEQNLIRENVGSQDQVWAASGGLNTIEFLQNGNIMVKPIIMDAKRLKAFESKFMLFFTGISRYASEIAEEQIRNTSKNREELREMQGLVDEAHRILTSGSVDFSPFGRLLDATWQIKRRLSKRISNDEIDALYSTAVNNGAVGGKLLGAGGGGFILFYAEPEDQERVKEALNGYIHIPFKFEFNGSEIIVYKPNYK